MGNAYLAHYGVPGMKWGVWNAETQRKYEGPKASKAVRDAKAKVSGKLRPGAKLGTRLLKPSRSSFRETVEVEGFDDSGYSKRDKRKASKHALAVGRNSKAKTQTGVMDDIGEAYIRFLHTREPSKIDAGKKATRDALKEARGVLKSANTGSANPDPKKFPLWDETMSYEENLTWNAEHLADHIKGRTPWPKDVQKWPKSLIKEAREARASVVPVRSLNPDPKKFPLWDPTSDYEENVEWNAEHLADHINGRTPWPKDVQKWPDSLVKEARKYRVERRA